jgi:hypothetical protein
MSDQELYEYIVILYPVFLVQRLTQEQLHHRWEKCEENVVSCRVCWREKRREKRQRGPLIYTYDAMPILLSKEMPLDTAADLTSPATGAETKQNGPPYYAQEQEFCKNILVKAESGQQIDYPHQVSHSPHSPRLMQRW